jgi:DNA repair exonuclease SbcCD ATPase subunit
MRFQKLIIKNTFSHRETEFDLDNRGLCLIVGRNGAGKSSLIKSLLFCLFGIGADSVINRTVGSDASVTLVGNNPNFLLGTADCDYNPFYGDEFKIRRYRKHKKHKNNLHFFINDKPVTAATNTELQKKVEDYIGLDYRAFLNTAAFSSEMLMFGKATDVERKAIFEKILQDLDVYNEYFQQAKEEQQALRAEVDELRHSIEVEERELSVVKKVLEVEKEKGLEHEARQQQKLEGLREELGELELKLKTKSKLIDKRLRTQRAQGQLDGWLDEHPFDDKAFFSTEQELHSIEHKIKKLITSDKCTECNQPITPEHRESEKIRLEDRMAILIDIMILFEEKKEIRQSVTDKRNDLDAKGEGIRYKLTKYDTVEEKIEEVWNDLKQTEEEVGANDEVIRHWSSKVKKLSKKIASLSRKIKENEEALVYMEEVTVGFSKQGIPNVIIARALKHLEERANHYLDILTNGIIGIKFSGFSLTKKGAVRNKIGINVISPSGVEDFDSYSGGEKQRLNIALLLALRDVAEFNKGVELNCLWMDEVLDLSLDEQGIEDVTVLLHNKKDTIASIFIVSPKETLLQNSSSEYDSVVNIVKEDGFSKIV